MADMLICSKNRAAQLDLTLQSIDTNFDSRALDKIYIIYKFTDEDYQSGYELISNLERRYEVEFIRQDGNLDDCMRDVFSRAAKYICIMTDDTIIYRPFRLSEEELATVMDEDALSFSLRAGLNTQLINYHGEPHYEKPLNYDILHDKFMKWNFKQGSQRDGGHFRYPFSCDGSFIRTADLRSIHLHLQNNYRPFESQIVHSRLTHLRQNTVAFLESVSLNIPINQTTDDLRLTDGVHYPQDPKIMNDLLLDGYRIDFSNLSIGDVECCFKELLFTFTKSE